MTDAPTQAVVLCGGLGTRLRPYTDTMPKPMVPVNGQPFLQVLLEQLREAGLQRVLLLTGYRGEMIRAHFGEGRDVGLSLTYAHGPVEWDTGRRIWEAREHLDPHFLLLYSDNFAPFRLEPLLETHRQTDAVATLSLRPKDKGNIRLGPGGVIEAYDPSRSAPGLTQVEIGYMLMARDGLLSRFPQPDLSLSTLLQGLAAEGALAGLASEEAYQSISDPVRWQRTEAYLRPKRVLLLDRDGTLNRRPPRGEYVRDWSEFHWIEDSVEALLQLSEAGFTFLVISNQAGIGLGLVARESVEEINRRMVSELLVQGVEVRNVYFCPHHWEDACRCRKPAPGLFYQASAEHLVRLDRTVYVGDDPRDCLAAQQAGCPSVLVGPEHTADPGPGARPAFASAHLSEAVPWLIERFTEWGA